MQLSIEDYKKIKKKIKSKVKSVRKDVISKMLKNQNMKNLWHGVNTICGRKTSQTEDLTLLDPDLTTKSVQIYSPKHSKARLTN